MTAAGYSASNGRRAEAREATADGAENARLKVVYVAGYGRSGTTLLSIALGEHPAIFSAGEIHELTRSAWAGNNYCACGAALHDCVIWREAVTRWLPDDSREAIEDYRRLQLVHENSFRPSLLSTKASFDAYAERTQALFRRIAEVSGKSVIVDSSKLPGRARALSRMDALDLYVVHLVRDGRGVAWSLMNAHRRDAKAGVQRDLKPKSTFRTSLRWAMVNLAAERLADAVGPDRYVRVRYEDFAADPAAALGRIGDVIGVDLGAVGDRLESGAAMDPRHQLAGSRMRMNAEVKIEKDEKWRSQMPASSRRIFTGLAWFLLRRYNYLAERS